MRVDRWTTVAIGVDKPSQRKRGPKPIALRGAELDAKTWFDLIPGAKDDEDASALLIGEMASWRNLLKCLNFLTENKGTYGNLLITFSGLGCCLPIDPMCKKYQQAICLHDHPVVPSMLEPLLIKIHEQFDRVVLLLDAAFCNVESDSADTTFLRQAMINDAQSEYAPLRSADPTLLELPDTLENAEALREINAWQSKIDRQRIAAEKRFEQLADAAGVEVVLADVCHAWETSDIARLYEDRNWQGVFSFAAQHALQFGEKHHAWNQIELTQTLIPRRFFPQVPVRIVPQSNRTSSSAGQNRSKKVSKRSSSRGKTSRASSKVSS